MKFVVDREILLDNSSKVWRFDYSMVRVMWAFLLNMMNKHHVLH